MIPEQKVKIETALSSARMALKQDAKSTSRIFKFDRSKLDLSELQRLHLSDKATGLLRGNVNIKLLQRNLNLLLDRVEKDGNYRALEEIAYVVATAYHETGHTLDPGKREKYNGNQDEYFGKKYGPLEKDKHGNKISGHKDAKGMGHVSKEDGAKYYGRGYVQLTWKKNYEKFERECDRAGLLTDPDLALNPDVAYCVLSEGSRRGLFVPGQNLSKYINEGKTDYKGARSVINGKDKAEWVAEVAKVFEKVLRAALIEPGKSASLHSP